MPNKFGFFRFGTLNKLARLSAYNYRAPKEGRIEHNLRTVRKVTGYADDHIGFNLPTREDISRNLGET